MVKRKAAYLDPEAVALALGFGPLEDLEEVDEALAMRVVNEQDDEQDDDAEVGDEEELEPVGDDDDYILMEPIGQKRSLHAFWAGDDEVGPRLDGETDGEFQQRKVAKFNDDLEVVEDDTIVFALSRKSRPTTLPEFPDAHLNCNWLPNGIFSMVRYWMNWFPAAIPPRVAPAHLTPALESFLARRFIGHIGQAQPYPAGWWTAGPPRAGAFRIFRAGPSQYYPLVYPWVPVAPYYQYRSHSFMRNLIINQHGQFPTRQFLLVMKEGADITSSGLAMKRWLQSFPRSCLLKMHIFETQGGTLLFNAHDYLVCLERGFFGAHAQIRQFHYRMAVKRWTETGRAQLFPGFFNILKLLANII